MTVPDEEDEERPWRKSSHSGEGQDCVEVRLGRGKVGVRDSKDLEGGFFTLPPDGWRGLINKVVEPD